jgi:hypothetical protein
VPIGSFLPFMYHVLKGPKYNAWWPKVYCTFGTSGHMESFSKTAFSYSFFISKILVKTVERE